MVLLTCRGAFVLTKSTRDFGHGRYHVAEHRRSIELFLMQLLRPGLERVGLRLISTLYNCAANAIRALVLLFHFGFAVVHGCIFTKSRVDARFFT